MTNSSAQAVDEAWAPLVAGAPLVYHSPPREIPYEGLYNQSDQPRS